MYQMMAYFANLPDWDGEWGPHHPSPDCFGQAKIVF